MKLTVLLDNNTLIDQYLLGEPGVCYHIEIGGRTILFDTGYSDVFIQNAQYLGIDLKSIDTIVLSHGHNDHSWGLGYLIQHFDRTSFNPTPKIELVAHPDAFSPKFDGNKSIGANFPIDCYSLYLNKIEAQQPYYIADNLIFLGQIRRLNDFEGLSPAGETVDCCGERVGDFVLDDSALVYTSHQGIVVITGCSHSGICNIVDYAISITGDSRVLAVIGGFHLLNASEKVLTKTAEYLSHINSKHLYPCHCTDLKAKLALAKRVCIEEVGVGTVLEFL